MAHEISVQSIVHKLEEGGWAKWVQLALAIIAVTYVSYCWMLKDNGFKGLTEPRAFEQAEIAREIARGNGFTTKIIRPAEMWLIQQNTGKYPVDHIPDTYHAPLWPYILAPFVRLGKSSWVMTTRDIQFFTDKIVVSVSLGFFLISIVINYFTACRLFDQRLANLSTGLLLICATFWHFAMSGLPQMLMLFLFSCAIYCLLRMVEVREAEIIAEKKAAAEVGEGVFDEEDYREEEELTDPSAEKNAEELKGDEGEEKQEPALAEDPSEPAISGSSLPWAAGTAALFGLLALTHGVTIWIFVGLLVFCAFYFGRRRWLILGIMVGIFAALYTPWMIRNQHVCGNPFGVSWYTGLTGIRGTESSIMRSIEPPLAGVTPSFFRVKVQSGIMRQFGEIYSFLGSLSVAPVFFLALLHPFKRRATRSFRTCVIVMWLAALGGMSVWGMDNRTLQANDLHVLFIPVMTFYGFAFVLVLWTRLEITTRLARIGFISAIYVTSVLPFLTMLWDLHATPMNKVEWPPYVPPFIGVLGSYTNEREIIMSDMPWAVAWYADRKALWLPMEVKDYLEFNDYDKLQGRIVGLYLTPVSGDLKFLSEIVKGEYKDWAPFVTRSVNLRNFPLKAVTQMPVEGQCIFYADRDRWTERED